MKKYAKNPIVTRADIPAVNKKLTDVSSVFNPGAVMFHDKILLILRVQGRGRETFLMRADCENGIDFKVRREVIDLIGIEKLKEKVHHIYDVRITPLENKYYLMFAMDFDSGCRLGLAVTVDFERYEFIDVVSGDDNRNGVLFPQKFGDDYLRLERPNKFTYESGVTSGSEIVISKSKDMINWEEIAAVFSGRMHYWDELIGAGPPPIKTKEGWLLIYHGVATHLNAGIYQAGVALLDLENPSKVIARGTQNILEPRELYETVGQVPNVIFPCGTVVDKTEKNGFAEDHSGVKIYYGAADTSVCLATSSIKDLIGYCYE